jgi:hypothetical protein
MLDAHAYRGESTISERNAGVSEHRRVRVSAPVRAIARVRLSVDMTERVNDFDTSWIGI